MKITVDRRFAPWAASADDVSRPVLAAVHLDPLGYLVAADGYCLTGAPCQIEDAPGGFTGANIPGKTLRQEMTIPDGNPKFTFQVDIEERTVIFLRTDGTKVIAPLEQGIFPNWRQMIPRKLRSTAGVVATFDPRLVKKVCDALGVGFVALYHAGSTSVGVCEANGGFGLIMPMYAERAIKEIGWVLALRESEQGRQED